MSLSELDHPRTSKLIRGSFLQTNVSIPDIPEIKLPPLPTLQELAQQNLPKDILKEPQKNLNERKIILEKQAQIEEKERSEREKRARFNERDYDFNGEEKLEEMLPPKFELWNQNNISCKSGRGIMDTLKMKGYANLPLDFRAFFKIKEEDQLISKEKSIYLTFKKAKNKNPHLYKFTKKTKLREVHEKLISFYEVDSESILTMSENSKRGEIFAKLFMKLNLPEILEKMRREEEANRLKELKEAEARALAEIPEISNDQNLKIINEDEEESEDLEEEKRAEELLEKNLGEIIEGDHAKEINEKIRELLSNKQIKLNGIKEEDLQKIMLINENYEEIIDYFDNRVMDNFEKENYEECVYLKGKKEEFIQNLKNYTDYESLLRTLIIYKLNNNI